MRRERLLCSGYRNSVLREWVVSARSGNSPAPSSSVLATIKMQFLFEIEDVFEIGGRGCVLVPGIPHAFGQHVRLGGTFSS